MKVLVTQSCPTLCNPHGLWPARLLCPWNSPGKNTGVGCHSLVQEIFATQGLNPGLLHCTEFPCSLNHKGRIYVDICPFIIYVYNKREGKMPDYLICETLDVWG